MVIFNQRTHRRKERKWAKIRNGKNLKERIAALVTAADPLPEGCTSAEIISAALEIGNSREQLELAWIVADEVARRDDIDVDLLAAIDAWTIEDDPNLLVVNVSVRKKKRGRAGATS